MPERPPPLLSWLGVGRSPAAVGAWVRRFVLADALGPPRAAVLARPSAGPLTPAQSGGAEGSPDAPPARPPKSCAT